MDAPEVGPITVLGGVNGAGKSSLAGAALRASGGDYWNPDEIALALKADHPELPLAEAQAQAWKLGRDALAQAVTRGHSYTFETTLGGSSMAKLLEAALDLGRTVRIWYVGLDTVERHIARVRARVTAGGHEIPDDRIRERFERSHLTLARLAPRLSELQVFDNSAEADPATGQRPAPRLLLHARDGVVVQHVSRGDAPSWCGPVFDALGLA